jgi:tetratricopeptide (TPR) repeat protein
MLSSQIFIARMILMSNRCEINTVRQAIPRWCLAVLLGILAVISSCSPPVVRQPMLDVNPVEIIERSPRIYHIKFEALADSMQAVRASAYLLSGIEDGSESLTDTLSYREVTGPQRARIEYLKAKRRLEVGAGRVALEHVRKALELDPGFRPAYVLLGNMLLAQGRAEEALDLFTKMVSWDVTDSQALIGLGRSYMFLGKLDLARQALVDAIIFDRVNLEAWKSLHMIGMVQEFSVADHDLPELGLVRKMRGRHYDILLDDSLKDCPAQATAWIVYASQRAVWKYEGKFKRYTGKTRYMRTYEEDVDCYMALAAAWKVLAENDSSACDSEYLDYLGRVAEEGLLVPLVLFDYVCLEHPQAARGFTAEAIEKIREYVNTFVLVSKG